MVQQTETCCIEGVEFVLLCKWVRHQDETSCRNQKTIEQRPSSVETLLSFSSIFLILLLVCRKLVQVPGREQNERIAVV